MKLRHALGSAVVLLAGVLVSCNPSLPDLTLTYSITFFVPGVPAVSIDYTMRNTSSVSLDNCAIQISMDSDDNGSLDMSAWTNGVDLLPGQSSSGTMIFTAPLNNVNGYDDMAITASGWDDPPDQNS